MGRRKKTNSAMRLFVPGQRKKKFYEGWMVTWKKKCAVKREETESGGKEGIEMEKDSEGPKREMIDCFCFALIAISSYPSFFKKEIKF